MSAYEGLQGPHITRGCCQTPARARGLQLGLQQVRHPLVGDKGDDALWAGWAEGAVKIRVKIWQANPLVEWR